ncbi:MAG: DNA-processing protein DprA [Bacteroidota bacterium]
MRNERSYLRNVIALSSIRGIGAAFMKKNRPIVIKYREDSSMLANFGGKVNKQSLQAEWPAADELIKQCEAASIQIISIADDDYPQCLLALADPPPLLFYRGNIDLLQNTITLTGTSNTTGMGLQIARRVGDFFYKKMAICNGLSDGIDKAIMEVPSLQSVAVGVIGGGLHLQRSLSPVTAQLAQAIEDQGGLLLSEFPPDKIQDRFSVIKSRRIQAALGKGLVLIQSPLDSGIKYTLRPFSQLKKPLAFIQFASHPEFLNHASFALNRLLMQKGKEGLREWSKMDKIAPGKILPITSQSDYELMLTALEQ